MENLADASDPVGRADPSGRAGPAGPAGLAVELRLPVDWLDYTILAVYFVVALGIGLAARRSVRTSLDFFLSGRSLPG